MFYSLPEGIGIYPPVNSQKDVGNLPFVDHFLMEFPWVNHTSIF